MPRRPDDSVPGRSADWRPHDTDRSIDPFDDDPRSARVPSSRPPVPPPSRPAPPRPGPSRSVRGGPAPRTLLLAGGGVLAVGATVLVFLTENADLLKLAVVAAAWAFVLATFVAGRGSTERAEAAAREAALRRTYEHELEREVAARREYELELENDLRREAEETMRAELDALRRELSAVAELRAEVARVAELRDEVARVAELRDHVAELSSLREEVARVGALRDDVLALTALRSEIGQVGELRAELGRLRVELNEQLSSEMLVERIVMRTQASRLTAEAPRREPQPAWPEEPPRELTGGWPAVRLEEHTGTQQYERVRVDRAPPPHPWQTVTRAAAALPPPYSPSEPAPAAPPYAPPPVPPPTEGYGIDPGAGRRSRHAAAADDLEPAPPAPREWPSARLDDPPTQAASYGTPFAETRRDDLRWEEPRYGNPVEPPPDDRPGPFPRRRRDDGLAPSPSAGPDELLTTERRAAPPPSADPPAGGRRRRRYREDDDASDDVLARVLRGD